MTRALPRILLGLACCLLLATGAWAQGTQTATLTGTVKDADGAALPGVAIKATSDALIGERTTASGVNGDYVLRGLPPGVYKILFELEGMNTVERTATLPLGGTARADATMEVAAVSEVILVTGEAPSALETTSVGANFEADEVNALPVPRNISAVAELSGGLTDNGTVANQVTISGAFAYDNVFMVNGVDINDNVFGTPQNLYIEDAVQETQVLTSGVSAEYGRFSGGVINAITKSGGNKFEGSLRGDYSKPEWRDETPYEKDRGLKRTGDLGKIYSATFGGPIVRDRLWFFLAGRDTKTDTAVMLPASGTAVSSVDKNQRYEVKLTGNITPNHSLQASYINNDATRTNDRQVTPLEMAAVAPKRSTPNDGSVVNYTGVFTSNLFGELRYSQRAFGFRGLGGTDTAANRSPIRSLRIFSGVVSGTYNAPYFDATDPEDRDNKQYYGALSYFKSTEKMGSHDLKLGYERFKDIRRGGNSQTATGLVIFADYLTSGSTPLLDSQGRFQPRFIPGLAFMLYWVPTRGAEFDVVTDSIFINDRWNLNEHFSFNIGARYEKGTSEATVGVANLSTSAFVPRLGASYDVLGDGKYRFDVTYSQYAGKLTGNQFGSSTPAGNPSVAQGYYVGPAGTGVDFAPGFDPNNYVFYYFGNPQQNILVDKNLKSPITTEITVSGGMQLGQSGYMKLTYNKRDVSKFIEDFIDHTTGTTYVTVGNMTSPTPTENVVIKNSDHPTRKYEALLLQGQYRILPNWSVAGNWTYQLKNEGNFEGEVGQSPAISSNYGNYPEVFPANRSYPYGRNDDYQEHKIRLWTNYILDMGRGGALDLGLIFRYDSPLTFSYAANSVPLSAYQLQQGAGYASLGTTQTLYFGKRGTGQFNSVTTVDLAVQYSIPVWKTVEPWVKFSVTNVLNADTLVTYNTTVSVDPNSPTDAYGLRTGYIRSSSFGKATGAASYQVPREYTISAGIRF